MNDSEVMADMQETLCNDAPTTCTTPASGDCRDTLGVFVGIGKEPLCDGLPTVEAVKVAEDGRQM